MKCPLCSGPSAKVIYYGMPCRLCHDERCSCLWSWWLFDWLVPYLPFNGVLVGYEGSYWRALWRWLTEPPP